MATPTTRPTLLLVDDESTNLAILREVLKDEYRLLFAKDGLQAIEIATEHIPDLILCDVMMPNLDGFGTCRRLKHDPRTAGIPVVFVTALADDVNETLGFEVGAVDYIYKPVSPPVLFARVRAQLKLVSIERLEDANNELSRVNGELQQALRRIRGNFESSIRMLSSVLEHRNGRLAGYCHRTALIAQKVAAEMGMSREDQDDVYHAALLHEIGKIGFPDDLLDKPQIAMTQEEFKLYRQHPLNAEIILMPLDELANASMLIRHQHERVDGMGFPDGLTGDAVPIGASILSATKYYLDLVMGRRAIERHTQGSAIASTRGQVGGRFPGAVVDALEAVVSSMPEEEIDSIELDAAELRSNMVLARDWKNQKGVLLLASGLVLSDTMVRQTQGVAKRGGLPLTLAVKRHDADGNLVVRSTGEKAARLAAG